jgi:hypothetical protein
MSTLITYKAVDGGDIQEVSPDPAPASGYSLNTNFRAIADSLPRNNYGASTNPTADNDSVDTAGIGVDFSKGSRWYNGTAIFECVNPAPGAAVWIAVAPAAVPTLEQVTTAGATTDVPLSTVNIDANGTIRAMWNVPPLTGSGVEIEFYEGLGGIYTYDRDTNSGLALAIGSSSSIVIHDESAGLVAFGAQVNCGGNNFNLNDGSGSGGGNLNLDGGQIVQLRADNQSSAPSSLNPGQIYYDTTTNHFYGWNGSAWKQLDN